MNRYSVTTPESLQEAEDRIIKPLMNGENISRWTIYGNRKECIELCEREEYSHLRDKIVQEIEFAKDSL